MIVFLIAVASETRLHAPIPSGKPLQQTPSESSREIRIAGWRFDVGRGF